MYINNTFIVYYIKWLGLGGVLEVCGESYNIG